MLRPCGGGTWRLVLYSAPFAQTALRWIHVTNDRSQEDGDEVDSNSTEEYSLENIL